MFHPVISDSGTLPAFLIEEQIAFLLASPHSSTPFLSVMDLFEIGGEMLAVRRRELQKSKSKEADDKTAKENKRLALQIETVAESTWKKRLLTILLLLCVV